MTTLQKHSELSDEELVALVKQKDSNAYAQMYRRHHTVVCRVVVRMMNSAHPHDVEDIVQSTFLVAYDKIDTIKDGQSLRSWLCCIARNRCFNHFRQCERNARQKDALAAGRNTGGVPHSSLHRFSEIREALESLSDLQREAVMLHVLGLTFKELATMLDVPLGTAISRVARGRKRLRSLLTSDCDQVERQKDRSLEGIHKHV